LRQDIPTTAHADNSTCLQGRNGIGEVADVVAQKLQTREVSIEAIYVVPALPSIVSHRCSIVFSP
jgi:hypothetical protein